MDTTSKFLALLVIASLILGGIFLMQPDPITPQTAAAELRAGAPGRATWGAVGTFALNALIGITLTALVGLIVAILLPAARQWGERLASGRVSGAWAPGPGAQWRRNNEHAPGLSRDDLMMIALLRAVGSPQGAGPLLPSAPPAESDPESWDDLGV